MRILIQLGGRCLIQSFAACFLVRGRHWRNATAFHSRLHWTFRQHSSPCRPPSSSSSSSTGRGSSSGRGRWSSAAGSCARTRRPCDFCLSDDSSCDTYFWRSASCRGGGTGSTPSCQCCPSACRTSRSATAAGSGRPCPPRTDSCGREQLHRYEWAFINGC
jgi:hypothetical protein